MQVLVNTDSSVQGRESLEKMVAATVEDDMERFGDDITRVEVHLSDENAAKGGGDDKRCMMEARLEGRQPTAVTHRAATVAEAVDGAADKLERSIRSNLGRLRDQR